MSADFLGEFIGTMLLVLLGDGVVANVILNRTKGNNSGWIVITFGWAIAVFTGVFTSTKLGSEGHLNPAVTLAMTYLEKFDVEKVGVYIGAQFAGAFIGAFLVWVSYYKHFEATDDKAVKLGVFSTAPNIRNPVANMLTEIIGTFVLVLGVLLMAKPEMKLGPLDALPVGLLILGLGLSLGGPTGYSLNPARDLAPRIFHAIFPIPNKGGSDWNYAWIPVLGPIIGGMIAAFVSQQFL